MTPQYAHFIAPARESSGLMRLVLGLITIAGIYFAAVLICGIGVAFVMDDVTRPGNFRSFLEVASPWSVLFALFTFGGAWIGVAVALRVWHGRSLGSQMGRAPIVLRDFVTGMMLLFIVGGGLSWAMIPAFRAAEFAMEPQLWLRFLPLALVGVLIQSGAEELVFRGYFQTQLAARFRVFAIALIVPSLCFGLAHLAPGQPPQTALMIVLVTAVFGLVAADLTAQTGTLGLAWGLHFANNCLAILLINATGQLNRLGGLALLRVPPEVVVEGGLRNMLFIDVAITLAVWLAARVWLRRR